MRNTERRLRELARGIESHLQVVTGYGGRAGFIFQNPDLFAALAQIVQGA